MAKFNIKRKYTLLMKIKISLHNQNLKHKLKIAINFMECSFIYGEFIHFSSKVN